MTSTLYIIPTPIGNTEDITLRALSILKSVDYVACEDTRVTQKLLNKYSISIRLIDCHKFNEKQRSEEIIKILSSGKDIALVSDAGTPLISDPGSILLREVHSSGFKTISVPGACAITTFLSAIERDCEEFAFAGFMPRSNIQQDELFSQYKFINTVFYESPNRLIKTLENIKTFFGEDKKIAIGRELTKIFEEIKTGSVKDILSYYSSNTLKGEIVGLIFKEENLSADESELKEKINYLKAQNYSAKDCVKIITGLFNAGKNRVYELVQEIYNGR